MTNCLQFSVTRRKLSQEPDATEIPSSTTQDSPVPGEGVSAVADRFMVGQMGGAALQCASQISNPLLSTVGSVLWPPTASEHWCYRSGTPASFGPSGHFLFAWGALLVCCPGLCNFPPSQGLPMLPDGAFPLVVTGSARLIISLPQASVTNPTPLSIRPDQLQLGADSDPSQVDDVEQDMDVSYFTLQNTFSDSGVSQQPHPPAPSTSSDLKSLKSYI